MASSQARKLYQPMQTYILVILLFALFGLTALGAEAHTHDLVHVTDDRFETNLSSTGYEIIPLNASDRIKPGSVTMYDPSAGIVLENPQNYTVISYTNEPRLNLTNYYRNRSGSVPVAVDYAAYQIDHDALQVITPFTDLLRVLRFLLVPLGFLGGLLVIIRLKRNR